MATAAPPIEAVSEALLRRGRHVAEALPYIRQFHGKTIVVKYGGAAMVDADLRRSILEDVVLMHFVGMKPLLVHGGGAEISEMMRRLGKESRFVEGLRVTDDETAEIAEMVLVAKINKGLVGEITLRGGRAVGLSGRDGNLIRARKAPAIQTATGPVDLGRVGEIEAIDAKVLRDLAADGYIPVVAPTGLAPDGGMLNLNADTVAGALAAALGAEKVIFMTDQPGVLRDAADPSSIISVLLASEMERLRETGAVSGGMLPKTEAIRTALEGGVPKVHVIDGRVPHALILEIFTDKGIGTMVVKG
jgi:acetylglutamate kinase